jgi:hypothetical protein
MAAVATFFATSTVIGVPYCSVWARSKVLVSNRRSTKENGRFSMNTPSEKLFYLANGIDAA